MLTQYPRPQFARKSWMNLNGEWNFLFDDDNRGEREEWYRQFPESRTILVPYTYETPLSGVEDERHHNILWYEREFEAEARDGRRLLLHFEGVDYEARVWVNGSFAGGHQGGYGAFALDITRFLKLGRNRITVRAEDSISCEQPRGKQRWKDDNFGCWYVQTTGIWKTVWLEEVSDFYLDRIKMTPDIDRGLIDITASFSGTPGKEETWLQWEIWLEGRLVCRQQAQVLENRLRISASLRGTGVPWTLEFWSPESPKLYDIKFRLLEAGAVMDEVDSYFGMRKISIEGGRVLLNNRPIYQRLILDQGYWEESHLTPPSEEAIIKDIDLILEAGYNGLRKHQKVEDARFLYWCDRKGLLVWSEMASQYAFSDRGMQLFTREWMEVVEQNYNHPSIITWTPFNESWGIEAVATDVSQQQFTESIYHLTKSFDNMRPVIVNDGWQHTVSDIITLHDYEEGGRELFERYSGKDKILGNEIPFNRSLYAFARGYAYQGQPVIISEYGGIALRDDRGWGYGEQVQSEEDFIKRFDAITSAIKSLDYVCGFCYTQLTDVQQEINGLYTMKREPKVDIGRIGEINRR